MLLPVHTAQTLSYSSVVLFLITAFSIVVACHRELSRRHVWLIAATAFTACGLLNLVTTLLYTWQFFFRQS